MTTTRRALLALTFALSLVAVPAAAQPTAEADATKRAVSTYVYLMDSGGNRVLVSTQFWRTDVKYDDRSLHRLFEVLDHLEKRGFHPDEKATIDNWEKPVPYARCMVYLEDVQAGRRVKNVVTTGTRVWCSSSGISELELNSSDSPKHIAQVLQRFDSMLEMAKKNLKK